MCKDQGRNTSKSLGWMLSVAQQVQKGKRIGVVRCKDPIPIIEFLKELNIDADSELMTVTCPVQSLIVDNVIEESIIFSHIKIIPTGFIFFLKQ